MPPRCGSRTRGETLSRPAKLSAKANPPAFTLAHKKALELLYTIFEGDRGNVEKRMSWATSSLRLSPRQCCSPAELFLTAPEPRMYPPLTVRLLSMGRHLATGHHPAIAR